MQEIYRIHSKELYNDSKTTKTYWHRSRTKDDTIRFIKFQFPQHFSRCKKIISNCEHLPLGCGRIKILDLASGPLTFSQAVLDELMIRSNQYSKGAFEISILAQDISEFQLKKGKAMITHWREFGTKYGWTMNFQLKKRDLNFSTNLINITNWLQDSNYEYLIIGISASILSGFISHIDLFNNIINELKNKTSSIFIIEPNKRAIKKVKDDFLAYFSQFNFLKINTVEEKTRNLLVNEGKSLKIFSIIALSQNIIPSEYFNLNIYDNKFDKIMIYYNKAKNWLLRHIDDEMIFYLYEYDLDLTKNLIKRAPINLKSQYFHQYPIRKGMTFTQSRNIEVIPLDNCLYSILLLETIGRKLDNHLNDDIYGGRLKKKFTFSWVYEYYPPNFTKFLHCGEDLDCSTSSFILVSCDIKKFYDNINRDILKKILKEHLEMEDSPTINFPIITCKIINELLGVPTNLNSDNCGIPLVSPLSPLISNLYLSNFDKIIRENKKVCRYARYIDDMVIIGNFETFGNKIIDKEVKVENYLDSLGLELNMDKVNSHIFNNESLPSKELEISIELDNIQKRFWEILYPLYFIPYSLTGFGKDVKELNIVLEEINFKNISEAFCILGLRIDHKILKYRNKIVILKFRDNLLFDKIPYKSDLYDLLEIPNDCNKFPAEDLAENLKDLNSQWYTNYSKFQKTLFDDLKNTILKWEDLFKKIEQFNNTSNDLGIISEEKRREILDIKESLEFKLSFRKIRFLIYKLTIIISKDLMNNKDNIFEKIEKLDLLGFPLKILGRLFLCYDREDLLIKKLKLYWENIPSISEIDENSLSPKIFDYEAGYFIRLLIKYYKRYPKRIINFKTIIDELIEFGSDEINTAITELIFKLRLVNDWNVKFWLDLAQNSGNIYLLKNIILCLAIHSDSKKYLFNEIKRRILRDGIYFRDENLINLCLHVWDKLKELKESKSHKTLEFFESFYDENEFDILDELRAIDERIDDRDFVRSSELDIFDEFIQDINDFEFY